VQRALSLKENDHIEYLAQRSSFKSCCMDTQAYTTNCSTGPLNWSLNFVQFLANNLSTLYLRAVIFTYQCHYSSISSADRATSHTQWISSGLLWQSRTDGRTPDGFITLAATCKNVWWPGYPEHLEKPADRGGSRNFHLGRPVNGQANFG